MIVSRDPDPPYDRTAVSKGYLGGEQTSRKDALLGDAAWYAEHDVELLDAHQRDEARPRSAHGHARQQGRPEPTASCCWRPAPTSAACGSTAPTSTASTTCARSATPTRSASDTENAEHVVLVGGSYIATEVAATLTALGRKVAIVMQEDVTLERGFGKTAGALLPEASSTRPRRRDPRRRGRRALRGRRRPRHRRRHQAGHAHPRRRGDRRRRRHARRDAGQPRRPDDRRARRRRSPTPTLATSRARRLRGG